MPANLEISAVATGLKSVFIPILKKGNANAQLHLLNVLTRQYSKSFKLGFNSM